MSALALAACVTDFARRNPELNLTDGDTIWSPSDLAASLKKNAEHVELADGLGFRSHAVGDRIAIQTRTNHPHSDWRTLYYSTAR